MNIGASTCWTTCPCIHMLYVCTDPQVGLPLIFVGGRRGTSDHHRTGDQLPGSRFGFGEPVGNEGGGTER